MSRESRTLLIVAAMAILGVGSLGWMAQRYGKIARQRHPGVERALEQVDAFIRVRRELRRAIDQAAPESLDRSLKTVRDRALAESGLDPARYSEIREAYRRWRRGPSGQTTPLDLALERRRAELQLLDLGVYEPLDS